MLKQAVVLVGGLGTRLGERTATVPKPMLEVAGKPFLEHLIGEIARHGIPQILLLAGHFGEQVQARFHGRKVRGTEIVVAIEPEPLGTGGALRFARDRLDETFVLLNGDSFFDFNLLDLAAAPMTGGVVARMALADLPDAADRYGRVAVRDGRVSAFLSPGSGATGPINAGIYGLGRSVIDAIGPGRQSLEQAVFPALVAEGRLEAKTYRGNFIDIGVPRDFERADRELAGWLTRPAVFFDRDGVLNVDTGYVYRREDFEWMPGAIDAIKRVNDRGALAFVVTNQGGIARGYYTEDDVRTLHAAMAEELAAAGAHVDAFAYCPHHPEGSVALYSRVCDCRKPAPGMLRGLMNEWAVDAGRALMVGDKPWDVAAGEAAGLPGHLFPGGDLDAFLTPYLDAIAPTR